MALNTRSLTTIALIAGLAGTTPQAIAQDDRSYTQQVHERCPGADILKIQRGPFDLVEVEYLCNGVATELGFRNGKLIYEELDVVLDEPVLLRIKQSLEKKYQGWLIDEISQITAKDTTFLKVEVILDGVEQNVFFTTTGRKFKPEVLLLPNKWTMAELSATALPDIGYDLLKPDSTYHLPDILREVSGIALSAKGTVLCVQDELGVVFEYDLISDAITSVLRFTDVGDFEDLTINGDVITVLRSDGKLFRLNSHTGLLMDAQQHPLTSLNYEGLFHKGDAIYIAAKEAPLTGPANARPIHRIRNNGTPELWRSLDADEVSRMFAASYPEMAHHNVRFHPSAMAIHPISGELYILSASDQLLTIHSDKLRIVIPLPAERFYKPEGLAFYPNGDLLISSEGDKKGLVPGSIMMFKYRGK